MKLEKKCPFCESTGVGIDEIEDFDYDEDEKVFYYQVFCSRCEAMGPKYRDRNKAIEDWNKVIYQYYLSSSDPFVKWKFLTKDIFTF